MQPIEQGADSLAHDRVRDHSPVPVNEAIDRDLRHRIEHIGRTGGVALGRRLSELDHEWDVDRAVLATFPVLGGLSAGLGFYGVFKHRKANGWLYLFGAQMGLMMMHALLGWCPPSAVFRRLGYRTQREISRERHALLAAGSSGSTASASSTPSAPSTH